MYRSQAFIFRLCLEDILDVLDGPIVESREHIAEEIGYTRGRSGVILEGALLWQ